MAGLKAPSYRFLIYTLLYICTDEFLLLMYLWDYRELIGNLVVSDLKIKYADSMLGFAGPC